MVEYSHNKFSCVSIFSKVNVTKVNMLDKSLINETMLSHYNFTALPQVEVWLLTKIEQNVVGMFIYGTVNANIWTTQNKQKKCELQSSDANIYISCCDCIAANLNMNKTKVYIGSPNHRSRLLDRWLLSGWYNFSVSRFLWCYDFHEPQQTLNLPLQNLFHNWPYLPPALRDKLELKSPVQALP